MATMQPPPVAIITIVIITIAMITNTIAIVTITIKTVTLNPHWQLKAYFTELAERVEYGNYVWIICPPPRLDSLLEGQLQPANMCMYIYIYIYTYT